METHSNRAMGWGAPLALAAAYGLAAMLSLALTRGTDGIATMWPSSGILLAGLGLLPARAAWRVVPLTAAASLLANLQAGNVGVPGLLFTTANMVEGVVGATLLRRFGVARPSFVAPHDVAAFCIAALLAATASTLIATLGSGASAAFAESWFGTVMLGMLVVAPMLFIAASRAGRDPADGLPVPPPADTVLLLALVGATSMAVFAQESYPILFLPLMAVLAASYRLGPFGAAAGVLIVATISSSLTALGHGPLVRMGLSGTAWFLQFYVLALFATALPLATLLAARMRLSARCAASERMHRLLAEHSTDIFVRLSLGGVALYASPAITRVLGYTADAVVGRRLLGAVHPDDRAAVAAVAARVVGGAREVCVYRHRRHDGSYAWLEAACARVDADGADEVVASIRDITKRRTAELAAEEAQRRVEEANRLLTMAEQAAGVGHWRLDIAAGTLFWSPQVFRIHGVEGAVPPPSRAIDFYHPDDRDRIGALVKRSMESAISFDFEARIVRVDGVVRHVISRGGSEPDATGQVAALFGTMQDVTRQVMVERELETARRLAEEAAARAMHMADTDALTGLASRRKTMLVLDDMIALARAEGTPLALAIFDVDHFKQVNDRFGHPVGDAVLVRVARAACRAVRPTDLVGRLGGEEFVVLLPGAVGAQAVVVAETLRCAVAASADGAGDPPVTVSLGIATLAPDGDGATLLGDADRALYRAKAEGRNAARLAA